MLAGIDQKLPEYICWYLLDSYATDANMSHGIGNPLGKTQNRQTVGRRRQTGLRR
jgi:hypothetical protein